MTADLFAEYGNSKLRLQIDDQTVLHFVSLSSQMILKPVNQSKCVPAMRIDPKL